MNNLHSEFNLHNIKCASCVNKIESKLQQIDGVSEATVSLLEKRLSVKYISENLDTQVVAAVELA
jgi:copper chaperone CopZ